MLNKNNYKKKLISLYLLLSLTLNVGCIKYDTREFYLYNSSIAYTLNSNKYKINNITSIVDKDLSSICQLDITLESSCNSTDLIWLNSCVNLEKLTLTIENDEVLKSIISLPNLKELEIKHKAKFLVEKDRINQIKTTEEVLELRNCMFIINSKNLVTLKLGDFNIDRHLLESITQVKNLYLNSTSDNLIVNYNFDYSKLTFLDNLIINNPYSLAVNMTRNDIDILLDSDVNILTCNENIYFDISSCLYEINDKIDELISRIPINYIMSNEEKLNVIIDFVIEELEYDHSEEFKNASLSIYKNEFYKEGYLYGALERKSAICGNYAALFSAVAKRFDLKSLIVVSTKHAWNMVYFNGNTYYIDCTFIDSDNDFARFVDITQKNNYNYIPINIPEILNISATENNKILSLFSKK